MPQVLLRSIQVLFGCVLALAVVGCSQGGSTEVPAQVERSVLVSPFTITLAAPSPSSPIAATVTGSSSLSFGAKSEVVSGAAVSLGSTTGVQTQPDALLNETWSRGTAALNDRVKIRGTLHAKARTLGTGTVVNLWDQTPTFDPLSTLSWQVSFPSTTATNVTVNSGNTPLAPGRYGTVTVNSPGSITLSTGTYYVTTLALHTGGIVKLDQARGPVVVYVSDTTTLRSSCVPLSGSNCNWLIAHLGTAPVYVETRFDGAVLAPQASLTLRALTGAGVHTGFFYAKDLVLDANARVQYRAPLAIIRAGNPSGDKCLALTAGQVPPTDLYKYCAGCDVPTDSDRDGFEDCADGCDFDPLKTSPGLCGCGVPDTDSDGDGTPDCLDACDIDQNNTEPGQCGCRSSMKASNTAKSKAKIVKQPVPLGTRCTDSACPLPGPLTCNGAGVCGNVTTCNPGGCRLVEHERTSYWFCPGPVTETAAAQACRTKQMALVRIDNFGENAFLKQLVTKPTWIGANSLATSGTWRWATAASDSGDQFWAGTATGSQRNSLFSFWATGAPAAQRCAVMKPGNARWTDVDCAESLGFICEYETPSSPLPPPGTLSPPPGDPGQPTPMSSSCVTTANSYLLPENSTIDENGIDQFKPYQDDANRNIFRGPAQNAPPKNAGGCPTAAPPGAALGASNTGYGCKLNVAANEPAGFVCFTDDNCTTLGPNLVCRQVPAAPGCDPDAGICMGSSHCGTLVCPPVESDVTTCQTIDICDPATVYTDNSNGQDLTPDVFNPASLFGGTLPNVQPSPSYQDDPDGHVGKDHPWCWMGTQQTIPNSQTAPDGKTGNANGGSKISFKFDPDLKFHANVNPLSLGDTDLDIEAEASLKASVQLNDFLTLKKTQEVLSAVANIHAHRCTISTGKSTFGIFGLDFGKLVGVPKFDTSDQDYSKIGDFDFYQPSKDCNAAVDKVLTAANRAKKAFRDAQTLLKQYNAIKSGHLPNFTGLCESVVGLVGAGVDVPGFPDGLVCPANEPAEITINRFIDYYQAPGFGQVSRMRDAVGELSTLTNKLFEGLSNRWEFGPDPFGESRTLYKADIQIGPVPVHLEVGVFYSYGAKGYFEIALKPPFNPFEDPPNPEQPERNPIATARAGVMPFASAGFSLFVGAGKDLGIASASVGIEGSVKLASLDAPIFAGAGIGAEVGVDKRSFAPDVAAAVGAATGIPTHLQTPKSFKFFVFYEYGAALNATDILSGTIDGRLRVKFLFFSRTWRKRIASFTGLGPITVNLVSGKSGTDPGVNTGKGALDVKTRDGTIGTATATVVSGTTDIGVSESQVPLAVLEPLTPPDATTVDDGTGTPFDPQALQGAFYDSLCCSKVGERCPLPGERPARYGASPCCPGSTCSDQGKCETQCTPVGNACATAAQFCVDTGYTASCAGGSCNQCIPVGNDPTVVDCTDDSQCCGSDTDSFIGCSETGMCLRGCNDGGGDCATDLDCCNFPQHTSKCDTDNKCHVCSNPSVISGEGGTCTTTADCCGAPDPRVKCIQSSPTRRECEFVNP